jgi:hypothetical protein
MRCGGSGQEDTNTAEEVTLATEHDDVRRVAAAHVHHKMVLTCGPCSHAKRSCAGNKNFFGRASSIELPLSDVYSIFAATIHQTKQA